MNLSKINNFFARFAAWQIRYRSQILAIMVIITVMGISGLPGFRTQDNMEDWFDDAEDIEINTKKFEEIFGNDDSVAVLVETRGIDVFDPAVMHMISQIGEELLENVPYAGEIFSLTDFTVSMGTEDGLEVINPFKDGIPDDPVILKEKSDFIMSRRSLVNRLVSDDRLETWIILSLENYEGEHKEEEMLKVGRAAREVVTDPKWESPSWTLKATGMAYTETEENEIVNSETALRVIAGFIVVLLCLIVFTRSLRGVIVPVIATVGGIGTVFGFETRLGIAADTNMLTLPVMLSMALSIGYAIHLINSFKSAFRRTGKRRDSVIEAVKFTGWPVFFTAVTTIASLISFLFAGIGPLIWLGWTSAFSVLAVYLYVIILVPVFYSFGKDKTPVINPAISVSPLTKTDKAFGRCGKRLVKKPVPVLIVSFIIITAFIPGLFRITVNMDYFSIMGMKIPFIQRLAEIMETKLGSLYTYQVMVSYPEQDAFKTPENMRRIDEFTSALGGLSLTKVSGDRPRVDSLTEIVKETWRALEADDPSYYRIPDDPDLLSQILFLYEISGGNDLYNHINEDFNTALLSVEIKYWDGDRIVSDMEEAKRIGREFFPGAEVAVIGTVAEFARMNDKIVGGELLSFSVSFIIILILMSIVFRDFKTGLIGMVPNIAPVIILGGLMGYSGTPLDMLTMTIMPMVLGIAVDDTIHFISRINLERESGKDRAEAVAASFSAIGKTLGMTTVILCAMFAVYTASPISMLFRMGVFSIIGLGSALAADYTITPLLMFLTMRNKNEKGELK